MSGVRALVRLDAVSFSLRLASHSSLLFSNLVRLKQLRSAAGLSGGGTTLCYCQAGPRITLLEGSPTRREVFCWEPPPFFDDSQPQPAAIRAVRTRPTQQMQPCATRSEERRVG